MPMKQNAPRKQSLGMATVLYITQNQHIFEYHWRNKEPILSFYRQVVLLFWNIQDVSLE
jgi:hypothetical protein